MTRTTKSSWLKGAVLVSSITVVGALLALPQPSTASIITTGCSKANFCSLPELFDDGSFQFGNLLLTDWTLVSNDSVNLNNIEIGHGYEPDDDFGIWSRNHALKAERIGSGTPVIRSMSFDFLVTGVGVNITQLRGDLAYRAYDNFGFGNSPSITGAITVGTSKGSNNLGSTIDIFSPGQDPTPPWINIPNGLNEIWVRNTITVSSSRLGYAETEFTSFLGEGPAFRNTFTTQESLSVPEPGTLGLLTLGFAGLICFGRQRGSAG